MKNKVYFIISLLFIVLIISCKKINLLSPSIIPPPTKFPVSGEMPDYIVPSPIPPENIEESYIEINPEIVANGTVFGGYGRRFKFQNEWYVLATNEYQYNPNTKKLTPSAKGALLKINNDGSTIIKIHSLSLADNLENTEYWRNLNSKKLVIESDKVTIPSSKARQKTFNFPKYPYRLDRANFYNTNPPPYYNFACYGNLIIYAVYRESQSLINWSDSANEIEKADYYIPGPDNYELGVQGVHGMETLDFSALFYIKGKLFITGQKSFADDNLRGYRDPQASQYTCDSKNYYTVDITKDTLNNNNWDKHEFPFPEKRQQFLIKYDRNKLDKVYIYGGISSHYEYKGGYWKEVKDKNFSEKDGVWSTEDGINWKEEKTIDVSKLDNYYYDANRDKIDIVGGYESEEYGTPLEPSYTELNGKYYRTFNSTYPIPPIKEIMETVDRFETNFTVTEEHIKKSGYYQLQVSSVPPDKAKESDWANIVPNNEITSAIGWESGGTDLFTFNNKIVRLIDYDKQFKLNNQYETALNLAEKYYNLLLNSSISDFKKYDYYFLYYKAMADMIKIIKDKGNDYFLPDEAVTHYTFNI
ncbi:hypothetical protein [Brachyspira hampsonii]|uniref:Uncharacterized protein n=2 Tax=Brachyspira hampsonii TaxID=1287055 RepID=A0AAC9XJA3_9SPIR|nr:hypothetical protein [Brachyspira hampsonii]ASJ20547.1 hypothetical protein BHAMNSH16_02305 [Brachyspira hampsonii]ELV05981.1 hypothetical protein H263_07097 [Brachyspira hampsonii 30599]OEJ18327.1 hypothetical protein A9496_07660 [Brachyspira hampsonii]